MLNQVILVGCLTENPVVNTTATGKKVTKITVAVKRAFKNADGVYETDVVKCTLWNDMASNTAEYCTKGTMVGIKGRIQTANHKMEVIAEKLTFLTNK